MFNRSLLPVDTRLDFTTSELASPGYFAIFLLVMQITYLPDDLYQVLEDHIRPQITET